MSQQGPDWPQRVRQGDIQEGESPTARTSLARLTVGSPLPTTDAQVGRPGVPSMARIVEDIFTFWKTGGLGRGGPKAGTSSLAVTDTCMERSGMS